MNIRGLIAKLVLNERMGSGPLYVRVIRPYKQADGAWLADEYPIDGDMCGWKDGHVSILATAPSRPEIVCLCGSTRFGDAWAKARFDLTLEGRIVLTIGCDTKSDEGLGITVEQKTALDGLHFSKIEMADRIHVLNVGGYIGESTQREIGFARLRRRRITYLEPV